MKINQLSISLLSIFLIGTSITAVAIDETPKITSSLTGICYTSTDSSATKYSYAGELVLKGKQTQATMRFNDVVSKQTNVDTHVNSFKFNPPTEIVFNNIDRDAVKKRVILLTATSIDDGAVSAVMCKVKKQ